MAAIGKIRKHSVLLLVIIGVALLAFILGDFVKRNPSGRQQLASIDGEVVQFPRYEEKVEDLMNRYKAQMDGENLSSDEQFQVRLMAWNQLKQEVVMNNEYEKVGIAVSGEELNELVRGSNPHEYIKSVFRGQDGQFDPQLVENFIQNLDQQAAEQQEAYAKIEQQIKEERAARKYNALIANSYYLPKALSKQVMAQSETTADVRLVYVGLDNIDEKEVTVGDAELKKWYDAHLYYFKQDEESRNMDYVVFDAAPSKEDRENIAEEVAENYKEFVASDDPESYVQGMEDVMGESGAYYAKGMLPVRIETALFDAEKGALVEPYEEGNAWYFAKLLDAENRPDSIKASHILISFEGARGAQVARSHDAAKAMADSIAELVKGNDAKFDEMVATVSENPTAKQDKGDFGWMEDGNRNFSLIYDSCYTMPVGGIRVLESMAGYLIVKVTEKTAPVRKVKVAMGKKVIGPSERTIQDVYYKASQFASSVNTASNFAEVAKKQGLNLRNSGYVNNVAPGINGVPASREVIRWAFNEKTKKNDVSQIFSLEDGMYLVAALTGVREKGTLPFEDIKTEITPQVKNELMIEKLNEKVAATLTKNKNLETLAATYKSKIDTVENLNYSSNTLSSYGYEPIVVADIFAAKKGEVRAFAGKNACYIVAVDEVINAASDEDKEVGQYVAMQQKGMFNQKLNRTLYGAIEKTHKIKDNWAKFY